MEMPGQRRLTRRFLSELQMKGLGRPPPAAMFGSAPAQPALQSAPGSLAEQAAQMEQFAAFGRKTTEELFIQSFVESCSSRAAAAPMAPEGEELEKFCRGSSEELFSSWISTSMPNQQNAISGALSPLRPNRTRQDAHKVSGELAATIQQNNNFDTMIVDRVDPYMRVDSLDNAFMEAKSFLTDTEKIFETSTKSSRSRNGANKQAQSHSAPDFFESKAAQKIWFESPIPVTRSRSSELRRRVAELEAIVPPHLAGDKNLMNLISRPISFHDPADGGGWASPSLLALSDAPTRGSDPSSSQSPPVTTSLSDAVGMLKGSLTKAKQRLVAPAGPLPGDAKGKKAQLLGGGDSPPPGILNSADFQSKHVDAGRTKWPMKAAAAAAHAAVEKPGPEGYAQISDSSGGAPEVPGTSGGPPTKVTGRNKSLKRSSADVDQLMAEPISIADLDAAELQAALKNQDNTPKTANGNLTRMASINSAARSGASVEVIDDATKKRRVDRRCKMTEAKGRGATSVPVPADLQAAMKRLDSLEKVVRSLRMNLSFMNRKDSEQTKHIEELEEENKALKHKLELANP